METLVITIVGLVAILVLGGLLVGGRSRRSGTVLEPPAPGSTLTQPYPPGSAEDVTHEVDFVEAPVPPKFRDRLGKTQGLFAKYLVGIRGRHGITDETWDDLEEALVRADVGIITTQRLLDPLRQRVRNGEFGDPETLLLALKHELKATLRHGDHSLSLQPEATNVWLFVGVNGVGKTTTVGKLGLRCTQEGKSVVMAAGDTFRAAAAEQLTIWAERAGADIVRGQAEGDPGAVIYDAIQRAHARRAEVVLADTAGRLHTKTNLMEELKKVKRICEREPAHLAEVLLVLDATTGQNGMNQAKQFAEAVQCTGVVLTKLDGSSKGGIALAIQTELGLPIKIVGLGEGAADLVDFNPDEFVDALFDGEAK